MMQRPTWFSRGPQAVFPRLRAGAKLFIAAVVVFLSSRLAADDSANLGTDLMVNGGFEEADEKGEGPRHWQKIDNLVWFWTTDPDAPQRGKVIKIDTDVKERQAYD